MTTDVPVSPRRLTHLRQLEAESIHVFREVVSELERPVLLYSIGKDSAVLTRLAQKAFWPGKPPFPFLHIDTTWKFKQMIEFRDRFCKEQGFELLVHTNRKAIAEGINPFDHGSQKYTTALKTQALLQALAHHGFDAAFGGARRDEERSRAKERVLSFRDKHGQWDPKNQRPELWSLFNGKIKKGESIRAFPLSNWTELDVWQYIWLEEIPIVPLYFAAPRAVVERDGTLVMVDDERMRLSPGESPDGVGPLPHARVLPAHRRGPFARHHAAGDHRRDDRGEQLGAARAAHRSRRGRLDGDQEARGLLLMSAAPTTKQDVLAYLERHEHKDIQRFVSIGSVDDGKSTLIGRLLHDSGGLYDDQLRAVKRASMKSKGAPDAEIDFSLFTDGLKAEREQGITIDVAYRYFATAARKFIIADTPGHEQYTRNMATGASTADVAVVLIDARLGVLQQSRRHAYIAQLLGIAHLLVGVNKMDLVGFDAAVFDRIRQDFTAFTGKLPFQSVTYVPISALRGDNVVTRSERTPFYQGPTMLEFLEQVSVDGGRNLEDFRFPVQIVLRPNLDYRGYAAQIASGVVRPGDVVMALPSRRQTTVTAIDQAGTSLEEAFAPMSVTLRLADEMDVSRGDMLVHPTNLPRVERRFDAMLVWMHERPLDRAKSYLLKHTTQTVRAEVESIACHVDLETLEEKPAERVGLNDIARVTLHAQAALRGRVPQEPGHRRLHPHRLADQRHGGRRDGARGDGAAEGGV